MLYNSYGKIKYLKQGVYMANSNKKNEIRILLRDYMNFLPPGPQDPFVPVGTMGNLSESSWPLSAEAVKRMDKKSLVGSTYDILERSLIRLDDEYPNLYEAILVTYLRDEAGHRDDDWLASLSGTSQVALGLHNRIEEGLDVLADWLYNEDLYVRWPQKAAGPKPGQNMEDKHNELYALYLRFRKDGQPYRTALTNSVFKLQDEKGNSYYSRRHADRIIKNKMAADDEK